MRLKINKGREWVDIEKTSHGKYVLVGSSLISHYDVGCEDEIGFSDWGELVLNLDENSDPWQCFGISINLQYKNVILFYDSIEAKNMKEIKEALKHITLCAWNPWDI